MQLSFSGKEGKQVHNFMQKLLEASIDDKKKNNANGLFVNHLSTTTIVIKLTNYRIFTVKCVLICFIRFRSVENIY